ncbi:MAG: radical SAM protein [Syntrophaceae bacterium]|nr:radical SAM protein [Syntrophaceae bacterium]
MEYEKQINIKRTSMRGLAHEVLSDPDLDESFHVKYVQIFLSKRCNSACKFCYLDGMSDGEEMSFGKADKIVDMFIRERFIVNPFVNEWIPSLWDYLKIFKKCNVTEISTNGIVIVENHKDLFPLLKENGITDIRITLLPPNIYENYTGRKRSIAIDAINLSLKEGFYVVVNYLLTKDTLPFIDEFCGEVNALGAKEIHFLNFINMKRAKSFHNKILSRRELNTFWNCFNDMRIKYPEINFNTTANCGPNPFGDNFLKKASVLKRFCLAGSWQFFDFIFVDTNGDIYPCPMLTEPEFKIGKIIEKDGVFSYKMKSLPLEKIITSFDRSTCASLCYTHERMNL